MSEYLTVEFDRNGGTVDVWFYAGEAEPFVREVPADVFEEIEAAAGTEGELVTELLEYLEGRRSHELE